MTGNGTEAITRGLLLAVAIAVGTWLRLAGIGDVLLFGDEHHTLDLTLQGYGAILSTFDEYGSHVAYPFLQRASLDLFGPAVWSLRLPSLLAGVLTLVLFFPIARRFVGEPAALVATLAFALSTQHIYYSRLARGYALLVLLALVAVYATSRALDERRSRPWAAVAVISSALVPVVHLSGAALTVAIAVVALWRARAAGALGRCLLAIGVSLAITALLYVPVAGSLFEFVGRKTADDLDAPQGVLGVVTVLAGGRSAAYVWLIGVPLALVGSIRRSEGRWIAAAILGPLLGLLVAQPKGMDYAYARYLITALPFLLMALAWVLDRASRDRRLTIAVGMLLVVASFLGGPRSPLRPQSLSIDNTQLALAALPVFDIPYPDTPPIYEDIASERDVRVLELPTLRNRGVLLLRNYQLQHGHPVFSAWTWLPELQRCQPPYVWIENPKLVRDTGVDWIVLHRNLRGEIVRYLRYVEEQGSEHDGLTARLITRSVRAIPRPDIGMIRTFLEERHGPPIYEDDDVFAWCMP